MRAFGTVAVIVFGVVVITLNGVAEQFAGHLNFLTNFWKVGKFEWGSVFLDQFVNIDLIEQ
jgi:hypothetical protein